VLVKIEETRHKKSLIDLPQASLDKLRDSASASQVNVEQFRDQVLMKRAPWRFELRQAEEQELGF